MTTWRNKQLAAALKLTDQRIGQLVKTGILPRPQGGHDPFLAVPAYLRFLEQRLTGSDLKAARVAKYAVETALKELEYKQKAGELVSSEAVKKEWFSISREVRDNFQNLPARTAGLVASERDQQRCHDILADEVRKILEGLTDGKAK